MRCKIGDLAFVVAPAVPSNLGALVEVVAVWPKEAEAWWVRSLCGPRMRKNGTVAEEGMVPDKCLRPLKSDLNRTDEHRTYEANSSPRGRKKREAALHG